MINIYVYFSLGDERTVSTCQNVIVAYRDYLMVTMTSNEVIKWG